jgi:DDE superfamily endonuclease
VTPRTFPPTPTWSGDGHRIKAPLISSRGYDKAWIYGALRLGDGQVRTQTAPARTTAGYLELLGAIDRDHPDGDLYLITDHLSSHTSGPIQEGLAAHPRVQQVFIPVGAGWLNLIEAWWRRLRRAAYAGQCFANREEIALATRVATGQLNRHTHPWVWGRPAPPHRQLRRRFIYSC